MLHIYATITYKSELIALTSEKMLVVHTTMLPLSKLFKNQSQNELLIINPKEQGLILAEYHNWCWQLNGDCGKISCASQASQFH